MSNQIQPVVLKSLAAVLWLLTTAVGLFEIQLVHRIFLNLFNIIGGYQPGTEETFAARYQIGAFYQFSIVIIAALWMVFFLISTNHHFKYAGQRKSWQLFGWTIGVQVLIVVVDWALRG